MKTCSTCAYFKQEHKDGTGLCHVSVHVKLMPWVDSKNPIVGRTETCDLHKPPLL